MKTTLTDSWAGRAREAFLASQLTLHQLGLAMGYPAETARQDAWDFLYRTPRPPMLEIEMFARALGVPVKSFTESPPKSIRTRRSKDLPS
jgi:hypothetical protein